MDVGANVKEKTDELKISCFSSALNCGSSKSAHYCGINISAIIQKQPNNLYITSSGGYLKCCYSAFVFSWRRTNVGTIVKKGLNNFNPSSFSGCLKCCRSVTWAGIDISTTFKKKLSSFNISSLHGYLKWRYSMLCR